MIPKIIHYCWFGKHEKPELAVKCIESWRRYCPDYQIIEWNEDNCDLKSNSYVRQAYEAKKWAFVTDYIRLKVLTEFGGVYMDTDVEILKPIDVFLDNKAFSGFEDVDAVPTGIMACEKGFPLFSMLLSDYSNRQFIKEDGSFDYTTNTVTITKYCVQHGLILNNKKQTIEGFTLYPKEFFCPKSHLTGEISCTDNTYTIHHFSGSWHTPWQKFKAKVKTIIGVKNTKKILDLKKRKS